MTSFAQTPPADDDVLLRNGVIARVRDLRPSDRDVLVELHDGLSEHSRYMRFFHVGRKSGEHFVDSLVRSTASGASAAFVVLVRGDEGGREGKSRAVGLGSCVLVDDATAEVAFVVADDVHGHGIGTLLLERLADRAQRAGVQELIAVLLADNRAMLDVLRRSGFSVLTSREHETVEVRFPVHLTDRLMDAMAERERRTDVASVSALLAPTSVAVIGASRRPDTPGNMVVRNLLDGGFEGPVYPVNPAAGEIHGLPAYASVLDVPTDVDLAVVAVPAAAVAEVVRECVSKRVRGVVVLSSGFAETGPDGRVRQDEVLLAARRGDMRVVGPNCLGIANTDPEVRLHATFAAADVLPGPVGMMTQSGAVGIAVLQRANELGIGMSAFVSAGNKADISGNDMLMYLDGDDRTRVIALYLESFGNPRKFSRIARHVSARKPIVALVGGASKAGRRAASGHTSSAVTSSHAVDALFGQCGVIRAHSLEQFLRVTSLLSHQPLPRGRRVAVVGNGGGPGVLAADALVAGGLELAELAEETTARVRELVPTVAGVANPVDLGAGVGPEGLGQVLDTVLADPAVDAVVATHTPVPGLDEDAFAAAVRGAVDAAPAKTMVAVMLGERGGRLPIVGARNQVPVFGFPEDAADALDPVVRYVEWRDAPGGHVPEFDDVRPREACRLVASALAAGPGGARLDATDVRRLLGCYGIDVVSTVSAAGKEAAVDAAAWAGYPVVLKVAEPDVVHKSDAGGVQLDLAGPADVRAAYDRMTAAGLRPDETGVLVQPQVGGGVELIVGVSHDELFGPLVMFGLGGTTAELLGDRTFRLTPLTAADAARSVRSLRGSPLLFGYRGTPPVDVAALEDLLLRVGRLADDLPEVAEIDLNPVIVNEHGIAVVDAKIRIHPAPPPVSAVLPRLRPTLTGRSERVHQAEEMAR